jgi:hypothetical protein
MVTKGKREWSLALAVGLALTVSVLGLWLLASPRAQAAPPPAPETRSLRQTPTTLVVTSTASSGPGTLRWALSTARVSDTITFDHGVFPPASPTTITLGSALPKIITDGLTIDGSNAGVVLDGSHLWNWSDYGLVIWKANGVTIQGLQILHFPSVGIKLDHATGCLIGGDNTVGDGPLGQGNLISGNEDGGVHLYYAAHNTVSGNRIGTDRTGTAALGNEYDGVSVSFESEHNLIGGDAPGEGNLISGNGQNGVELSYSAHDNVVSGNYVGTDVSGTRALSNGDDGIYVAGYRNLIGGDTISAGNWIAFNGENGIQVYDHGWNRISHNSIHSNGLRGIENAYGGNRELSPPALLARAGDTITGTAPPDSVVEIFSDDTAEGRLFEGVTQADASGIFTFTQPVGFAGPVVNATATDGAGNTSEFGWLFSLMPMTCTVTSTADSGAGTLRECLLNVTSGELITFDTSVFPPDAPATIMVRSDLPPILVSNLTLDGSDAGVILDGSNLSGYLADGLVIRDVTSVTIQGLQSYIFRMTASISATPLAA